MADIDMLREKFRKDLMNRYRRDFREGVLTSDQAHKVLDQLRKALEKAKRTNRRVSIDDQEGTWSEAEIEDQLSAIKQVLDEVGL